MYVCMYVWVSARDSQRVVVVDFDVVVDLLRQHIGGAVVIVGDVLHNLAHVELLALQLNTHLHTYIHNIHYTLSCFMYLKFEHMYEHHTYIHTYIHTYLTLHSCFMYLKFKHLHEHHTYTSSLLSDICTYIHTWHLLQLISIHWSYIYITAPYVYFLMHIQNIHTVHHWYVPYIHTYKHTYIHTLSDWSPL